ncbi:MAG: VOC family protein [Saprospiraceae bacterium]|nr:VOC family protein [Saprospiraceae bacterium]
MKRALDHIVYCVPNLEEGMEYIEALLGAKPTIGGRHLTKGTKNALLNLGNSCYLEILAADTENVEFKGQRWMGIDLITKPKITRWSLKSENLIGDSKVLEKYDPRISSISGGKRKTADGNSLSWEMILPASTPEIELMPFMTDWSSSSTHPTNDLPEMCTLKTIELTHPNPSKIHSFFDQLQTGLTIRKGGFEKICITIQSPNGLQTLC